MYKIIQKLAFTNKGLGLVKKNYELRKVLIFRYWKRIDTEFERRNVSVNKKGNVFVNIKLER